MSTFIVSAGHGLRDPGALSAAQGLVEHLEAYPIAWRLRAALEAKGHACEFISCFQSLSEKIEMVNKKAVATTIACAVEVHFNSADSHGAHGTEVLYFSDSNKPIAEAVSLKLSTALGTKNRGSVKRANLGWLTQTYPAALIVEVLFISNQGDAETVRMPRFHEICAKAIAEGLTA